MDKAITACFCNILLVIFSFWFQNVRSSDIGDVVILDVDKNELRSPFRDSESLPPDLVRA